MKIPRTMSTQHPDNVLQPFFVENSVIAGDDEIKEAFYAFSHLKIKEQLWDCEGKEVDNFVVEKLLSRYGDYFQRKKLGKDVFITLRGPNPRVEQNKGKLLLETLEGIPRNFDMANEFYQDNIAPIFEVTIPMVTKAAEVIRVKDYYKNYVIAKKDQKAHDLTIKRWVGDFEPKDIKVIPLIEDKDSMLNAHNIVKEYVSATKEQEYQRVWLARSDPALNYGNLTAILVNRLAFQRIYDVQDECSVELYPIIGCGSVPFRGNFRPDNYKEIMKVYPSVQTYTMQSAFKYDYPEEQVRDAATHLEENKRHKPLYIDEATSMTILEKVSDKYRKQVTLIAPLVNQMAAYIPQRRKRKMHIGLFGYSRDETGVRLPRAIKFCAALYSLGIPPELLGMDVLTEKEWEFVHENTGVENDLKDALRFLNRGNLDILPPEIKDSILEVSKRFDVEPDHKHKKVTGFIYDDVRKNNLLALTENIERAASIRKFLG